MASCELATVGEDLWTMSSEQLIELVTRLRGVTRAQEQSLNEIIDQRDAALLLNELCHFGKDDPCAYDVGDLRNKD